MARTSIKKKTTKTMSLYFPLAFNGRWPRLPNQFEYCCSSVLLYWKTFGWWIHVFPCLSHLSFPLSCLLGWGCLPLKPEITGKLCSCSSQFGRRRHKRLPFFLVFQSIKVYIECLSSKYCLPFQPRVNSSEKSNLKLKVPSNPLILFISYPEPFRDIYYF